MRAKTPVTIRGAGGHVQWNAQGVEAPVDVLATEDGLARLRVYLPDRVKDLADWPFSKAELQILGPGLDAMSEQAPLRIINPYGAFAGAFVATGFLLLAVRLFVRDATGGKSGERLMRFVQGADGNPSLARFQMLSWTVLVIAGFFYVFFASGDLLNVSQQVLILLGMAGAGAVGARWIDSGEPPKTVKGANWFWRMLSVNGSADLLRLQLFLFTVAIWVYVAARLLVDQRFPELDGNVLLLMGITNGVYVGGKYADSSGRAQEVGKLCTRLTAIVDDLERKKAEINDLKEELAALTQRGSNVPISGREDEHKAKSESLTAAEGAQKELEDELKALSKELNEQAVGVTS